ncbi:hypothetical protein F511_39819 [Dorcoceras hygrometricum]|uniref:Uncharacterized protein n=1 Tax=Dorcoceras hygrometricum TaxID=472368 RepID=A0A2Z7BU79_9LAMI|nr:hypothetical protein F511_39819 [Dorcoceras hygrometricum]
MTCSRDPEEKLSHFVEGLRPTFKLNVRLAGPRSYREAVDKALRVEKDWKDVEQERQQMWQSFQQADSRPPKKQNRNQQRPQELKPIPAIPISVVPAGATSSFWVMNANQSMQVCEIWFQSREQCDIVLTYDQEPRYDVVLHELATSRGI